jgi:hypothetical protein
MPATKSDLVIIKRSLMTAIAYVREAAATARRAGDAGLAGQLYAIAVRLEDELDYVDHHIAALP